MSDIYHRYESSLDADIRKQQGSFYTPEEIASDLANHAADILLDQCNDPLDLDICDPCCGSGSLLYAIGVALSEQTGVSFQDICHHCLYGMDLDDEACKSCRSLLNGASINHGHALVGRTSPWNVDPYEYTDTPSFLRSRSVELWGDRLWVDDLSTLMNCMDIDDLANRLGVEVSRLQCLDPLLDQYREDIRSIARSLDVTHWHRTFPDVFEQKGGFDVVISNPPFVGRSNIRSSLEDHEIEYIQNEYTDGRLNELAGPFLLRFDELTSDRGSIHTILPNTMSEGACHQLYMSPMVREKGWHVVRACRSRDWTSDADVSVSTVHLSQQEPDTCYLDHLGEVETVSSRLDSYPEVDLKPIPSSCQIVDRRTFQGVIERGDFRLDDHDTMTINEQVQSVPPSERDALKLYLNGRDLQSSSGTLEPKRLTVDFFGVLEHEDMLDASPDEQKSFLRTHYPHTWGQIEGCQHDDMWWTYHRPRPQMRRSHRSGRRTLLTARVSKHWSIRVFDQENMPYDIPAIWTNAVHSFHSRHVIDEIIYHSFLTELVSRRRCSTLHQGLRYNPSQSISYIPFPGEDHVTKKRKCILDHFYWIRHHILEHPSYANISHDKWGLTEMYNRYDDPSCSDRYIEWLRESHVQLLNVVFRLYGWDDLQLDRNDWTFDRPWTDQITRFVPPHEVRYDIINRFESLNHEYFYNEGRDLLSSLDWTYGEGKKESDVVSELPDHVPSDHVREWLEEDDRIMQRDGWWIWNQS